MTKLTKASWPLRSTSLVVLGRSVFFRPNLRNAESVWLVVFRYSIHALRVSSPRRDNWSEAQQTRRLHLQKRPILSYPTRRRGSSRRHPSKRPQRGVLFPPQGCQRLCPQETRGQDRCAQKTRRGEREQEQDESGVESKGPFGASCLCVPDARADLFRGRRWQ